MQGLELKASEHPEGRLIEPVTGEVFEWSELKKVSYSYALLDLFVSAS